MNGLTLQCKTTAGVGDFMYALNKSYMASWRTGVKFNVEFHWKHSKDHLHHYEDPETIIERFEYIHPYYINNDRLNISHHFNSYGVPSLETKRFKMTGELKQALNDNFKRVVNGSAEWMFRETHLPKDDKKVVIWRPLFNAEEARLWKRVVTNDMWENVIDILERHGYNVVELTYRTPIREAHYHIATCNFIVCYDGMWHYIAKNYYKPMIVASRSAITKLHTPHALMLHDQEVDKLGNDNKNIVKQLRKLHIPCPEYNDMTLYDFMVDKALRYQLKFELFYDSKEH